MARRRRTMGLSRRDRQVLDIERRWGPGRQVVDHKFDEAQRDLGLSPGAYSLIVNSLIDDPEAFAADPNTVSRLRGIRDHQRDAVGVLDGRLSAESRPGIR